MGDFTTAREALYGKQGELSAPISPNTNTNELLATLDLDHPDQKTPEKSFVSSENPLADFFFFPEEDVVLYNKGAVVANKETPMEEKNLDRITSEVSTPSFITETLDSAAVNVDLLDPSVIVKDFPDFSLTDSQTEVSDFSSPVSSNLPHSESLEKLETLVSPVEKIITWDETIAEIPLLDTPLEKKWKIAPRWTFFAASKKFFPEVKLFSLIFVLVFSLFFLFTNAKLVALKFSDIWQESPIDSMQFVFEDSTKTHASAAESNKAAQLQQLAEQYKNLSEVDQDIPDLALNLETFLGQKTSYENFDLNTLPPGNRLIIPSLDLNVPLIDVPVVDEVDFAEGNFDAELEQGVVKYPTTPTPDKKNGNTLIFGHTSLERWKKNEYGYIFRNIPKLKAGDEFYIIREGNSYHYKMVERKIVLPKNVEEYYHNFSNTDKSYLTLMGCYPIGSNEKRMMIVAERIA